MKFKFRKIKVLYGIAMIFLTFGQTLLKQNLLPSILVTMLNIMASHKDEDEEEEDLQEETNQSQSPTTLAAQVSLSLSLSISPHLTLFFPPPPL